MSELNVNDVMARIRDAVGGVAEVSYKGRALHAMADGPQWASVFLILMGGRPRDGFYASVTVLDEPGVVALIEQVCDQVARRQ